MDQFEDALTCFQQAKLIDYLNQIGDAVAICDPDWNIVHVNEAWRHFAEDNGAECRDFVGSNYMKVCSATVGVETAHGIAVSEGLERLAAGEQKTFTHIYPCNAPDERRWFRLTATMISGISHGHRLFILRHKNVTREVEFVPDYIRRRIEANIAHDIKSNLNAVVGYVQFGREMLKSNKDFSEIDDHLQTAEQAGWKLAELLDGLVDVGRITSADQTSATTDVRSILERSCRTIQKKYSNVSFSYDDLTEGDKRLLAEEDVVARIVDNLVSNAFKYNRPGGHVHGTIETNTVDGIVLRIADQGEGIKDEAKKRIFDAYIREESTADMAEGKGVGLTSARELVSSLDGELTVESEVGVGSTFSAIFPTWRTVSLN